MRSRIVAVTGAAIVALLVVTNPVVVEAARQVTGAQIEDGTIHKRDIATKTWRALQDQRSYRFQLPEQDPAHELAYSLDGVPPGKYLFVYHVFAFEESPAATMHCSLRQSADAQQMLGHSYAVASSQYMTVTGGGAIQVTSQSPHFSCQSASDTFEIGGHDTRPPMITLTRVDSMTSSTAEVAPAR